MSTPIIVRDPEIMSGAPVFRGTRVPLQNVIDYLKGGSAIEEFLDDFPSVSRDDALDGARAGERAHPLPGRMRILLDECLPRKLRPFLRRP